MSMLLHRPRMNVKKMQRGSGKERGAEMAVDMMAPLTSPSCATMTMVNNNTEFYSFYVNVYNDKFPKNKEHLVIPSGQSLTRETLQQKLYDNFGIRKDSRIFYIDDDGDNLPIDSECEFQEALKLAKTSSPSKGLVLFVRPWIFMGMKSTKQYDGHGMKQERDEQNTMKMMFNCISNISTMTQSMTNMITEMNERQKRLMILSDTRFRVDDSNVSSRRQSPKVSLTDTSPPPWFIEYMESMKKEMVSTVTQEVMKQMMEMLNKRMDSFKSFLSNEINQSKRRSHSFSKRHPRCSFDSHLNEKNQKKMNTQDEGHFSDASIERVDEPQDSNVNVNAKDHDRQLQQAKLYLHDLDNIKGQIHELLKEKQYYRADEMTNNLDIGINNRQECRQSVQSVNDNNVQEDIASPICSMTSDALKILDGELRMNCSITGNRALNIDSFHENTWCDDLMEDIDKISYCSGCSIAADEREHVDTFVMVEMPMSENVDPSLIQPKGSSTVELQQRNNSRDSPSFELLSETSSPRSSYVEEEYFVNVFSVKNELQMPDENQNPTASSTYMVDIHGKIYNEHLPTTPDTNVEFEKRSDGVYSFVAETLPVRETDFSKLLHTQQQMFSEQNLQYNTTSSNDGERNQLPNYSRVGDQHQLSAETFYWTTHSQSKTDTNDFMQSFHSHTTSVTDNNNDLFDKTKDTQKATTTSKKATRHSVHNKKSNRTRTDETHCNGSDTFSRSQQSSRTSGSDSYSNGSRRTFGEQLPNSTADPVLILPETLLTMAAQVGSIAYVTARDMFDKLRSHAKEDPVKRRRVKLNTATDSCSSSSATHRPTNQS